MRGGDMGGMGIGIGSENRIFIKLFHKMFHKITSCGKLCGKLGLGCGKVGETLLIYTFFERVKCPKPLKFQRFRGVRVKSYLQFFVNFGLA